jgi:hypothetical protein
MLTEVRPGRPATEAPIVWSVVSGVAGLVANLLLVAFFLVTFNLGRQDLEWLGTVNDALIIVSFLALVPVALGLQARLAPRAAVRVSTMAAVVAMAIVAVLQLLLILGVLTFDVQVILVAVAFLPVYGWVLTVSSVGHRSRALPRAVTRFGLVLGVGFLLGELIFAASLPVGWGTTFGLTLVVVGAVLASSSWLALPVWPLLLARFVFGRPSRTDLPRSERGRDEE